MKRFLAVLAGGVVGLGALFRRRRHLRREDPSPADELRAKLAEADERAAPEPVPEEEAPSAAPVDDRRREVHDRARQALDELSDG